MLKTLKWMLGLMVGSTMLAGGGAWWFYQQKDALVRDEVLRQIRKSLPGTIVELRRARFDLSERLRLYDLSLVFPDEREPAVVLPEVELVLNQKVFLENQSIEVQSIRCWNPTIRLRQRRDGQWNFQLVRYEPAGKAPPPKVLIQQAQLAIEAINQRGQPWPLVRLNDLELGISPVSETQFAVSVAGTSPELGRLKTKADLSVSPLAYSASGSLSQLRIDQHLLSHVDTFVPQPRILANQAVLEIARKVLPQFAPDAPSGNLRTVTNGSPELESQVSLPADLPMFPDLGLELETDVTFTVSQAPGATRPVVGGKLTVRDGYLNHPLAPCEMAQCRAEIDYEDGRVTLHGLEAKHAQATLRGGGWADLHGNKQFDIVIDNFELTDQLRPRLPNSLRKISQELSLTGVFNATMKFDQEPGSSTRLTTRVDAKRCAFRHEKFKYPVTDAGGWMTISPDKRLDMQVKGLAGKVPVLIRGLVFNPGPGADAAFDIHANNVPIDRLLREACPPQAQRTLSALQLEGMANVVARLVRPAGVGQKIDTRFAAQVYDASVQFTGFKYRLTNIKCEVVDEGGVIQLRNLTASHNGAQLEGSGQFERFPEPGLLNLVINAKNAAFDEELYAALPEVLQKEWTKLNPRGFFDIDTKIDWVPGGQPNVEIPRLVVFDGSIEPEEFRFPWNNVAATFSFADQQLTINEFSARHDDTLIRLTGGGDCRNAQWRMWFNDLIVDDVTATPAFRRALPANLRSVVETLNPAGNFSIRGNVEFAEPPEGETIPHSTYNLQFVFPDTALTAGAQLEHVHGLVNLRGESNAEGTQFDGHLDIDSLRVFGHQLNELKGPISLNNQVLLIGSKQIMSPVAPTNFVPSGERISAKAIDGTVYIDSLVKLDRVPAYRLRAELNRGSLDKYAQLYMRGQSNLGGVMNGWMDLEGRGPDSDTITGQGKLHISPAALYELPIFVQMFRSLRFDAGDKSAFRYADLNFDVVDSRFNFKSIDLDGPAIRFLGRGHVRFDGAMMLDFYSMLPRNQIRVPVLHELATLLSRAWVGIEVRGNVGAPAARVKPVPEFDDALKQFLGSFDQRPAANTPSTFKQ